MTAAPRPPSSTQLLASGPASTSDVDKRVIAALAELEESTRASLERVRELLAEEARRIPSADESLADAALARPDGEPALPRAATILVVDDEASIRQILQRLLERLRYQVVVAANGREGLDAVLRQPPDLVLTDVNMPGMHGLSLLRELKSAPGLRHIPVVVISGEDDRSKIVQSIELGADDYVAKPFDPTLLQARVQSSLARKRMRDLELDHLKRVAQIAAAAQAVDRNAYKPGALDSVARGRDQIAQLARVFERMVLNLKSREDRLAYRLKSLRREVSALGVSGPTFASRSDSSPFATGDVVAGRYYILGTIGRGGMGMVYHARDAELEEDVALKVVRSDAIKEDPTLASRLRSEIRLARKLAHPNIVRSFDLGEFRGTYFITMEYVRGVSLSASLDERGRFSPDAVIAIGIQLADALAVAHAQDIIHRDIKPGNVMMDEDGRLKVMDFGLAKHLRAAVPADTRSGHVIGTPQYMAPEQLTGATLDARTDLFSVGILLYECLTGKPPFDDEQPAAMLTQMVNGSYPPLTNAVPEIPRALDRIVRSLLQLDASQRIQTASALSRELSEVETGGAP